MSRARTLINGTCLLLCCAGMLLAGCSDNPAPVAPGVQPEVINNTDNFQFQVTALENYTGTLIYQWRNTGQLADINQSCSVTQGSVSLLLLDNQGAQVYTRDLTQNGSFVSDPGTAGVWSVRVIMSETSGTLNFRADMRPAP